jgi:hypothetical protein
MRRLFPVPLLDRANSMRWLVWIIKLTLCNSPPPICLSLHLSQSTWYLQKYMEPYSYSTTNKMHLLSQIIYSCKTLYMFRTVFPSISRSSEVACTATVYVKQLLLRRTDLWLLNSLNWLFRDVSYALPHAFSLWPFTVEAAASIPDQCMCVFGIQSSNGHGFSRILQFSPVSIIHSSSILITVFFDR